MINCDECNGACCQSLYLGELLSENDAELLEMRGLRVIGKKIYSAPCAYLYLDGKCLIYVSRPLACRTFKPGCELCVRMRALWFPPKPPVQRTI